MELAQIEGNLSGYYRLDLKEPVLFGDYQVIFEFKNEGGNWVKFLPPMHVSHYQRYAEFNLNADYSLLQLRVTAIKPYVEPGDCLPTRECNECAGLVTNWKQCT